MAAQRKAVGKSPPSKKPLKERWDRLDESEAKHGAEGHWLEDERWAIARELSERNAAGATYQALADESGRSKTRVGQWSLAYRRCWADRYQYTSFNQALVAATGRGQEEARASTVKSRGRSALRQHSEALAPEIAKALEKPEVAEAVADAMAEKERHEVIRTFIPKRASEVPPPPTEAEKHADRIKDKKRKKAREQGVVRFFGNGSNALELLQAAGLPDLQNEDDEFAEPFRWLVIKTLTEIRVECDLIERKLDGEQITQEEREQAVAEARAERELEDVDIDDEFRGLLEGRS